MPRMRERPRGVSALRQSVCDCRRRAQKTGDVEAEPLPLDAAPQAADERALHAKYPRASHKCFRWLGNKAPPDERSFFNR